jgi:hypothetical protein
MYFLPIILYFSAVLPSEDLFSYSITETAAVIEPF